MIKLTEEQFRERVIHGLNARQAERFIQGRAKYNNDPAMIDYKAEIEQEYDDIVIYLQMDYVING